MDIKIYAFRRETTYDKKGDSNRSQVTGNLVNLFEGVTKDIKDERQPMGKRDAVV